MSPRRNGCRPSVLVIQRTAVPARKKCPHCGEVKRLDHFGLDIDSPDGHNATCFACRVAKSGRLVSGPPRRHEYERAYPTTPGVCIIRDCHRAAVDGDATCAEHSAYYRPRCQQCSRELPTDLAIERGICGVCYHKIYRRLHAAADVARDRKQDPFLPGCY